MRSAGNHTQYQEDEFIINCNAGFRLESIVLAANFLDGVALKSPLCIIHLTLEDEEHCPVLPRAHLS